MHHRSPPSEAGTAAPFGLPILGELPELAHALEQLRVADRAIAAALDQLVHLRRSGVVESATGVDLDVWLSIVARRTGTDRRMLLTVAATLDRLPQLHRCFAAGELSWAQLRTVVLQVHQLPRDLDEPLDTALAGAVADARDLEPDALPGRVRWIIADLLPAQPAAATRPLEERLVLQPRLDGSGGAVIGELGPVGFAALDGATRPERDSERPASRRAAKLTDLCLARADTTGTADQARTSDRPGTSDGIGTDLPAGPATPRKDVHVLLRVELETLLGLDDRPAQLLTTLAGGAMWTDVATARRLTAAAASLRLIVTQDGAPVGIGRRSRVAPDWVRDAILALHDTCSYPGCDRPARTADVDHATEWSAGGSTDVGNLGPLCAHHNRDVRRRRWQVAQTPDGTRRWHHRRTGLTTTTRPDRPPRAGPTTARTDRPTRAGATMARTDRPPRAGPTTARADQPPRAGPPSAEPPRAGPPSAEPPVPPHPAGPRATRRPPAPDVAA